MYKIIPVLLTAILLLPAGARAEDPVTPETTAAEQKEPSAAETAAPSEATKAAGPVTPSALDKTPATVKTQPTVKIVAIPINKPAQSSSASPIAKDEVLTLARCIDIALQQQPSLLASMYTVNANQSKVGEAQAAYFPQVNVSGGYTRTQPLPGSTLSSVTRSGRVPSFDSYTGTAALTQLLYDFGKTPTQVGIAKLNLEATRSDLDATRAQTILAVKQAYYGLLRAQRGLEVAQETVTQNNQHLDQAKGFFEVGTKPKYDVTTAEVNLSNAKLNLITAENALRIAMVTLNNTMGVPYAPDYRIEDSLIPVKNNLTFAQAIDAARDNRPELIATGRRVKASEEAIFLATTGFFPVISGSAAYNRASSHEANFKQDGWNAGVAVNIPIFSGFLTYHQVREADANYKAAKANYDLLIQNVILEVQQAYLNLVAAADKIPTAELAQQQATENLEIASGRYAAGVGNPIEVTDAQVTYTNAKTNYTQALYDYAVAVANLEKSMGVK